MLGMGKRCDANGQFVFAAAETFSQLGRYTSYAHGSVCYLGISGRLLKTLTKLYFVNVKKLCEKAHLLLFSCRRIFIAYHYYYIA